MAEDVRVLLGLLAEPDRLRVVSALTLAGPATVVEVARTAGLDPRVAQRALSRLETAGLAVETAGVWELRPELLREAVRASAPAPEPRFDEVPAAEAAVLRAFLRDGRLTTFPAQASKRAIVLDHVSRVFDIGVRYPEKQVDAMLRAFHDDYAALRRYLVEGGFLSRDAGVYWRSGGSVEV